MKQIKSRSMANPAHIRSLVGERAWKRISASGVASELAGEINENSFSELRKKHYITWGKELRAERDEIIGKFKLEDSELDAVPIKLSLRDEYFGTENHERKAYTIRLDKDSAQAAFIHPRWHMDKEGDEAHHKYLPFIWAEFEWLASKNYWKSLAENDCVLWHDLSKNSNEACEFKKGYVFRRAKALPRIVKKLANMVGLYSDEIKGYGLDQFDLLAPEVVHKIAKTGGSPIAVNATFEVRDRKYDKGNGEWLLEGEVSTDPSLSLVSPFKEKDEAISYRRTADKKLRLNLDFNIADSRSRLLARKIGKLVKEFRNEVANEA